MYTEKKEELKVHPDKRSSDDEIDVGAIAKSIGRGLKIVGNGIANFLSLLIRRLALISVFVVLGLLLSFGVFYVTKPYYTSSMTLVLSDIRNEFVENHLTNLSEMIGEGNISAVSEQLDIRPDAAEEIKEMKFVNLDQDRVAEDSVLTGSPFRIQLSIYDNMLFDSLEPAITKYLENNRYFSKQKRIRQREIESLIFKLKNQIESIDSVKTTVVTPNGPVNGFVYGQPIDPTNLYRESMTLYEQQVKLEAELDQLDNIQVVNGFTPRFRPTGPSLLKYLILGGAIGFLVGLIVALTLESRKPKNLSY